MGEISLTTEIVPKGPAAAIVLTDDQAGQLSSAKTPPVVVTIGTASARLRVASMGGERVIGLSKAARAELGVEAGDTVTVTITADEAERTVEVPADLAAALAADPAARAAFDRLSYTRRKEIARSLTEAKKAETRERRLAKVLTELT